jgi:hypothetical protein
MLMISTSRLRIFSAIGEFRSIGQLDGKNKKTMEMGGNGTTWYKNGQKGQTRFSGRIAFISFGLALTPVSPGASKRSSRD